MLVEDMNLSIPNVVFARVLLVDQSALVATTMEGPLPYYGLHLQNVVLATSVLSFRCGTIDPVHCTFYVCTPQYESPHD